MNNKIYLETYTNEYGEQWWFDYDKNNDMGILWGNDSLIVGDKFYIFDGTTPKLILNSEEKEWITNTWKKHSVNKNIYLDLNTCIKSNKKYTYLSNNICPLCLKTRADFEGHHCVPASEGGSDDNVNVLLICNTCHSLITNGCKEDLTPRYLACIYHQILAYGVSFYMMNPENNKRFSNKDMGLYKNRPHIKEMLDYYNKLDENDKIKFDNDMKRDAIYFYKYYRNIVQGYIHINKQKKNEVLE